MIIIWETKKSFWKKEETVGSIREVTFLLSWKKKRQWEVTYCVLSGHTVLMTYLENTRCVTYNL